MALIKANLEIELRKIFDTSYSSFEEFPQDLTEASIRWSEAINSYAKNVIPTSINSEAAKQAFATTLLNSDTSTALPLAFTNYATLLASGMLPTFVATPPPISIDFTSVYALGFGGGSSKSVASLMSTIIDTWFKTGTAIPSGGGSVITWS